MKTEELEKFLVKLGRDYFEKNKSEIKPLLPENEEANALVTDLKRPFAENCG